MLGLHARHVRDISGRAAPIFWVVEQAASASKDIAALWAQMTENRRAGARWAAAGVLAKPGLPPRVTQHYAEEVFWVAIDPGTYRSLTLGRGLSLDDFEAWVRNFYEKMLGVVGAAVSEVDVAGRRLRPPRRPAASLAACPGRGGLRRPARARGRDAA
jgi:hypothetical protein